MRATAKPSARAAGRAAVTAYEATAPGGASLGEEATLAGAVSMDRDLPGASLEKVR